MSCNGCRVLRKGCSDDCMLRQCLEWIHSPQAQAHATVFVAKFFGRAGLMSFISSVPQHQRPALFRSLLYEAVGRTVNPVNGVVGLLWTGNWKVCQSAVETVLLGGALDPLPEYMAGSGGGGGNDSDRHACSEHCHKKQRHSVTMDVLAESQSAVAADELQLCLMMAKPREGTPSGESGTTTLGSSSANCTTISSGHEEGSRRQLLGLFI
ncbi:hypothetical protein FNV43_RR22627 [Rhamnella rubrinervis]|uniref:LOB domain-containing protein n=1 Tax=Rhamnella rubrinervis TaxID=2594499 RepID=A0A8K0GSN5_9ROSA|nr:hypothetical protein FNV43_RR22627 [Rhamnella rubrinervis]